MSYESLNSQIPSKLEWPIELSKLDKAFWVLSWNVDWKIAENKNFWTDMVRMTQESLVKPDDFNEWCCKVTESVLSSILPNFQKSDYLV